MWTLLLGLLATYLGSGGVVVRGQGDTLGLAPPSNRVLENRATGKCLTLSKDYNLVLDTCNYNLDEAQLSGVFSVGPTFRTGQLLRWKTGTRFEAPEGCLQALQAFKPKNQQADEESHEDDDDEDDDDDDDDLKGVKRGEVRLVVCNNTDDTLNWEFERKNKDVDKGGEADEDEEATTGKYWVKKSPDGPCLAGWTKTEGKATVFTLPCKADDDRQLWRICEEEGPVKCDK